MNQRNSDGVTALMHASVIGHAEVVRELIARGADLSATDNDGFDALIAAATGGSAEACASCRNHRALPAFQQLHSHLHPHLRSHLSSQVCQLLVDKGLDVNVMAGSGGSPLMIAARTGAADAVRILLDAGATVDALAKPSEAFVQEIAGLHAQDDATLDETTAEAKRQRLDAFFEEGSTALMYAAALGHREIVSMLVAAGASARLKDKDGQSPLVHAANMGAVAIADELITKANADPNDTTGTGVPLLIKRLLRWPSPPAPRRQTR